jgi:hypothetical protein
MDILLKITARPGATLSLGNSSTLVVQPVGNATDQWTTEPHQVHGHGSIVMPRLGLAGLTPGFRRGGPGISDKVSDNQRRIPALMLTIMKIAGSSPCDAEGASEQLNNVETAERPPSHSCMNPRRMRSTQEATGLLQPFGAGHPS